MASTMTHKRKMEALMRAERSTSWKRGEASAARRPGK
jgi:hypothetical protein